MKHRLSPIEINARLSESLEKLSFQKPVHTVYNPLEYAWENFSQYLETWARPPKRVVYLGMNPGPWGMAQTGIPFGDVQTVKEWLQIDCPIHAPEKMHPKRPILGLDCPRVEVSGSRLWGWIRQRWETPQAFFEENFILNYCPLVFVEASGKNRTPVQLPAEERRCLEENCDWALGEMLAFLDPEWVLGIGTFAEKSLRRVLKGSSRKIGRILHPSPASPAANRGWQEQAEKQLADYEIYAAGEITR